MVILLGNVFFFFILFTCGALIQLFSYLFESVTNLVVYFKGTLQNVCVRNSVYIIFNNINVVCRTDLEIYSAKTYRENSSHVLDTPGTRCPGLNVMLY